MLSVIAKIQVKPEAVAMVKAEMLRLVGETVKESGCLNYTLHQDQDDPSIFVFYENWASAEDLARHLGSPHILAYRQATQGMVVDSALHKLTKLA